MSFLSPIWLIVLAPSAVCMTLWPPSSRLLKSAAWTVWVLLVVALADPVLHITDRGGTVVMVVDRSESMPAEALTTHKAMIETVNKGRRPGEDLAVVSFRRRGETEMQRGDPSFLGFNRDIGADCSNLHDGLARALDSIPEGVSGRIVVLSDGRWAGADPAIMAARAALRGIGIDFQVQQRPHTTDLAITALQGPEAVECGQGFIVNAWFDAPESGPVSYTLKNGARTVASGTTAAVKGSNRLLFRDLVKNAGTVEYDLELKGARPDGVPENDRARLFVTVRGAQQVLCLSPGADSGLARALRASGMEVVNRKAGDAPLSLAELTRYSAVILENVPARVVGTDSLYNLAGWVKVAGGGLMLTGGERAYGQGGYLKSPVDPILPVMLEMRREHRKMSLAIAVALDRSGSMSLPAGNGRTKMDLADLGTAEVIKLLSDFDHAGVVAVDSMAHEVLPMAPVPEGRSGLGKVMAIESCGGGIFIYEALKFAAAMVSKAPQKNKHIILFADAADSEEPGDYRTLLAKCRAAGVTVSVVGLGTEADCDAELLKEIATLGGGRIFFSAIPEELPAIFAQETFAVTGSSFSDQPAGVRFTPAWADLGGVALGAAPKLDGYNICYLKKEALAAAVTTDKDVAPVIAHWLAGAGRVLCYMGEADGKYGRSMAAWKRAGDFYTAMGRWTAGMEQKLPGGMVAARSVRDGRCVVDLYLDPTRDTSLPKRPVVHILRECAGREPVLEDVVMDWLAPDQLQCAVLMNGRETVLPVIELPGGKRQVLAPACLPVSPEFAPVEPGKGKPALQKLAVATGGGEVMDLASVWDRLPRGTRDVPLRRGLIFAALVILMLAILQRRTGWLVPVKAAPGVETKAKIEANKKSRPGVLGKRRNFALNEQVQLVQAEEPKNEKQPPSPPVTNPDTLDALRKARSQAGRLNRRE